MDSFAFWCQKKDGRTESVTAIMNFNLWTQCGWDKCKTFRDFLDVGFLISNLKATEKLFFYIPFEIGKEDIVDLGCKLTQSKILNAIFNENYCVTDIGNQQKHWLVKDSESSTAKVVFDLSLLKGNNYAVQKIYGGTLVTIDSSNVMNYSGADNNRDFYMRFRIRCDAASFIREFKPKKSFLQSTIASTYIIDFRFNNLRSLDSDLIENAQSKNHEFIYFTKLHFFLMTKADIEVDGNSCPRELEEDIWQNYVDNRDTADVVAYHSSKKNDSHQTSLAWEYFTKLKVNKSTRKIFAFYIGWLSLITITLNIISSAICKFLFKW